jgi:hypothetical protein
MTASFNHWPGARVRNECRVRGAVPTWLVSSSSGPVVLRAAWMSCHSDGVNRRREAGRVRESAREESI